MYECFLIIQPFEEQKQYIKKHLSENKYDLILSFGTNINGEPSLRSGSIDELTTFVDERILDKNSVRITLAGKYILASTYGDHIGRNLDYVHEVVMRDDLVIGED
jgi:hypothetical protein